MANIKAVNNNYVEFYLESNITGKILMDIEPGNWDDDNLELDRAKHHGIFNKFSNSLDFFKKYKDIIENVFKQGGNNASLYLIKEELIENNGTIEFVEVYRGRADWETKKIKNGVLSIKFNSNQLEDLIKANESDEFELERLDTLDDEEMDELELSSFTIEGRELSAFSESVIAEGDSNRWLYFSDRDASQLFMKTKVVSRGFDRHSSVDTVSSPDFTASSMFFVDSVGEEADLNLQIKINLDMDYFYMYENFFQTSLKLYDVIFRVELLKIERVETSNDVFDYEITETDLLFEDNSADLSGNPPTLDASNITRRQTLNDEFIVNKDVSFNEGLALRLSIKSNTAAGNPWPAVFIKSFNFRKHNISFTSTSEVEPTEDVKCIFVHDAYSRLLNIIANDASLFYSKYFGRNEIGYAEDGEGGLMGLVSGYWIRKFDRQADKYKSLKISFKDLLDSTNAMFNVGMGTQTIKGRKLVRIEDVKYFYQKDVVVDLGDTNNLERKYDSDLYFSTLEFGQNKGGDYDNETGLDEPNVENRYTTPDRKSTNKYRKISKIRSDETEMEILRRKPHIDFADEDFGSDSHNWFLDLKRSFSGNYIQRSWPDRLQERPQGINGPETYRSFFFTPLRMLFRHGWIIASGLQPYINKKIKFASSEFNSNLKTFFDGENIAFQENLPNGLEVGRLERPRILPEIVSFEAKISQEVISKIYGTTRVLYKGSYEDIPNYYFRFRWTNEDGEKETGYLMNMKPESLGKFTMQKANEN